MTLRYARFSSFFNVTFVQLRDVIRGCCVMRVFVVACKQLVNALQLYTIILWLEFMGSLILLTIEVNDKYFVRLF